MSQLQNLLKQLCPKGVKSAKLGEILDYEQPTPYLVADTDYNDCYDTPVLTAGQSFILGYTNEKDGIYKASKENPTIIFDDFTTSFRWVDFDFKVKSSAMKMLRPKGTDVSFRYVYYAMQCINYETFEHARQWISKYAQISIPLPPLEIQQEIALILDKFSQLQAELQAELQARISQYNFYRNHLLNFDGNDDVQWVKLGEVCEFQRGSVITQQQATPGGVPVIAGGQKPAYYHNVANKIGKSITVAGSGAYAGFVAFWNIPIFVSDAFTVNPSDGLDIKYLYYFLKNKQDVIHSLKKGSGVPHVHGKDLAKISIPIPPLPTQQKIVQILDNFERLVHDISTGLPAEIHARQQQYNFYRNQLLSFPNLNN